MTASRARLRELPLGAIRPDGWLRDQLQLQAEGQTGQLEAIWPDVGADSAWLGGGGEAWERGPYYLDGLVPLAYVLDDEALLAKAHRWIGSILASQRSDGQFGPTGNLDWWPRMVALKALTQYADATGDERVPAFLRRYFVHQRDALPSRPLEGWGRARGAENVLSVMWLHDRTGERWLVDLARLLLSQTDDWASFLTRDLPSGVTPTFRHLTHCVNVAMGLKTPAAAFLVDGDGGHILRTASMLDNLERLHGLVHGVFSGDEWLAGREPHHGVETCEVVELMFTLEQVVRIFGDGRHGDLLEQVAYNLLPAANDPRMLAHQYHQQANQVLVSFADRDWSMSGPDANVFGLEPHFGCCTANLHQGWPKFVRSLWMRASDDTLAAVAYAPCRVDAELGGRRVALHVDTGYPFAETVRISVSLSDPGEFGLALRIPSWCDTAGLRVAGEPVAAIPDERGYVTVRRPWQDGDLVELSLPMRLRTVPRDRGAVGLRLGPLVMVHAIEEIWRSVPGHAGLAEWEITPRSAWNLGIWLDDPDGIDSWSVERRAISRVPFEPGAAPVIVHGKGAMLRDWRLHDNSSGPLPNSPASTGMPIMTLRLLPYGSARLRVAELPTVGPVR
ncbi:MAG TPA: beta-L-arabinofuranosidase domain-containing protein [Actinopolymorphaceae bacterium]|nr:beta-L-arabinofuranosidase domain-containing protein [Actinopolymorphaceae bacterium]